jgi:hypothetical protein
MNRRRLLPALVAFAVLAACGVEAAPRTKIADPEGSRAPPNQMELLEARLPVATLSGSFGSVRGERGSWCWKGKHTDGARMAACADYTFIDPKEMVDARSGERLTIAFNRQDDPQHVEARAFDRPSGRGDPLDVPAANPSSVELDREPGTHWLYVSSSWDEGDGWSGGDVSYFFKIRVS